MAKKRQTKKSQKNTKKKDLFVMIGSIALTVVLVVTMILNAPIIDYRTITNGTMSTRQISIMKYFKVWQPLVQKEGTLQKPVNTDASALNLKEDTDNVDPKDDGLDLDQIVEGQYTVLFMGMDESGKLADVNWIFQFDIFAGTMSCKFREIAICQRMRTPPPISSTVSMEQGRMKRSHRFSVQ